MPNLYMIGDKPKCVGAFTDSAGSPVDPSTVTVTILDPDKLTSTYTYPTSPEVIRESAGVYAIRVPASKAGRYFYYFKGSGTNEAAEQNHFDVIAPVT